MTDPATEKTRVAAASPEEHPESPGAGERARPAKRNRRLILASIPVALFIVAAIVGPELYEYEAGATNLFARLLPPGSELPDGGVALLGTDQVGRDILGQVLDGARVSLIVGVATVLVGGVVGSLLGVVAGFIGGRADSIIMRTADVQLAFPAILLAILVAGILGPSVTNVIIALAVTRWVIFARVGRSSALSTKGREYVDAARVTGASRWRILTRYIIPQSAPSVLVIATVQIGLVILAEASLSFLGLGVPQGQASWGLTIANGRDYLTTAWWIVTIPGIALALVVVSIGLLGDELRDRHDPNLEVI